MLLSGCGDVLGRVGEKRCVEMAKDTISLSDGFKSQYKAMSPEEQGKVREVMRSLGKVMASMVQHGLCFRTISILFDVSESSVLHVVVTDNPVRAVFDAVIE